MGQIPKDNRPLPPMDVVQEVTNLYDSPTRRLAWPTSELYEDMLADARTLGIREPFYKLFSGFRSDSQQAQIYARHETKDRGVIAPPGNSAHRTGHAMDIYMGAKPGHRIDDSDPANINYIRSLPEYRTFKTVLAPRYNLWELPTEPWHWECDKDCRALFLMRKYNIDGELARQIVNYELKIPNGDLVAYLETTEGDTRATSTLSTSTKVTLTLTGLAAVSGIAYWYLDKEDLI